MQRRLTMSLLAMMLAVTAACGGGGGGGEAPPPPPPVPPTKALVKLTTAASATSIMNIESTLELPFGVTVRTVPSATAVETDAVVKSGADTADSIVVGTYSAATATISGSVRVSVINSSGLNGGEFATLTADLRPGVFPAAGEFVVRSVTASSLTTSTLPGVVVTTAMTITSGPSWSQAIVTLSSSGTTTPIGTIDVHLNLPAGATVSSAMTPFQIASGVVVPSGSAASNSTVISMYTAATATIPAKVRVQLINGNINGFAAGEFVTVSCDLPANASPTAADFTAYPAMAGTLISSGTGSLSSVTFPLAVTPSVTLQ